MAELARAVGASEEKENVTRWRRLVLVEAGYPPPLAERLARSEIDVHRAVELVLRGCRYETAAEILL